MPQPASLYPRHEWRGFTHKLINLTVLRPEYTDIAMNDERRSMKRKPIRCKVLLRCDEKIIPSQGMDISMGGLSIVIDVNLPPKKPGEVYFYMPLSLMDTPPFRAEVITLHGAYSHQDGGFRLGLKFQRMSKQSLETLAMFLA